MKEELPKTVPYFQMLVDIFLLLNRFRLRNTLSSTRLERSLCWGYTFLSFFNDSNTLRSSPWQGLTTTGGCRYRQAIPKGRFGGILDIDSNYGVRKAFLPQVLSYLLEKLILIESVNFGLVNGFM